MLERASNAKEQRREMQFSRDYYRFNFFIYLKHPFEQNNRIFQLRRTFDGERMKNEFPFTDENKFHRPPRNCGL